MATFSPYFERVKKIKVKNFKYTLLRETGEMFVQEGRKRETLKRCMWPSGPASPVCVIGSLSSLTSNIQTVSDPFEKIHFSPNLETESPDVVDQN